MHVQASQHPVKGCAYHDLQEGVCVVVQGQIPHLRIRRICHQIRDHFEVKAELLASSLLPSMQLGGNMTDLCGENKT